MSLTKSALSGVGGLRSGSAGSAARGAVKRLAQPRSARKPTTSTQRELITVTPILARLSPVRDRDKENIRAGMWADRPSPARAHQGAGETPGVSPGAVKAGNFLGVLTLNHTKR